MSFLDIASASSYGRFNIKFARMTNLSTAVYWSAIMNVLERVKEKKTYDENGFFTLNRNFVESKTSLTKDQQLECDAILVKLNLLDIDSNSNNRLRCNIRKFFTLITEENENEISEISKISKSITKESKVEGKKTGIIHRLQSRVNESDPEVYKLYCDLVEVAYSKGMTTNAQIDSFQDTLNKYTNEKEVKMEILRIAIAQGYKLVDWAIKIYEDTHKLKGSRLGHQKQNVGLDENNVF